MLPPAGPLVAVFVIKWTLWYYGAGLRVTLIVLNNGPVAVLTTLIPM